MKIPTDRFGILSASADSESVAFMGRESKFVIRLTDSQMVLKPSLETVNRWPLFQKMTTAISDQIDRSESDRVSEVVLDLCQVAWISSDGLNALIRLHTSTRQTGRTLRLVSLSETVADVFRMTRLERTFELELPETEASLV